MDIHHVPRLVELHTNSLARVEPQTGKVKWSVRTPGRAKYEASPLAADGKVFLGTGKEVFWVLAAGKELKVVNRIRMNNRIHATPTAANGVLYVATDRHLYAVAK